MRTGINSRVREAVEDMVHAHGSTVSLLDVRNWADLWAVDAEELHAEFESVEIELVWRD